MKRRISAGLRSSRALISATLSLVAGFTLSIAQAAQIVQPSEDTVFVAPGNQHTGQAHYTVSAPTTSEEVGLGLRIHYDSSVLNISHLDNVLQDQLQPIGDPHFDYEDFDNDVSTDRYLLVGWIDFAGDWPDVANLPTALFDYIFQAQTNFSAATTINFTASSTAGEASFESQSQLICAKLSASIQVNDNTMLEGENILFNVQLAQALPASCGDIELTYQVSGTATNGQDYPTPNGSIVISAGQDSVMISLPTINDSMVENDETIIIQLIASEQATLSTEHPSSASFTMTSDDVEVNAQISKTQLAEDSLDTATITLERIGDTSQPLTVSYQLSGTANLGQDYTVSPNTGTASFIAGENETTLVIGMFDDEQIEADETIVLTLLSGDGYQPGTSASVSLLIKDTDEVCFDVDGNGVVDALTDGITLTRYLIGLRGDAMIQNSLAISGATRTTAETVTQYIETHTTGSCYDVDGNQNLDALTDGILLVRYLVDYRGTDLVDGVIGQNASRTTGSSVTQYLDGIINP
jgi:hypothetical protein